MWKQGASLSGTWSECCSLSAGMSLSESREPIIYPEQFATLQRIIVRTPDGVFSLDKIPFYKRAPYVPFKITLMGIKQGRLVSLEF